jgi:threonine synthase
MLSTAHPAIVAKVSEAVTKALSTSQGFDFERDALPQEFRGLLGKERLGGVVDVDEPNEGAGQKGDRKQGWVGR